jgi:hypothetical protein
MSSRRKTTSSGRRAIAARSDVENGNQLVPGMVLIRARPGSNEAGIVLGPLDHPLLKGLWTVVHGYLDEPATCGLFEIGPSDVPHVWRRATPEEAAIVRALFVEHANAWGPDSNAWVALTVPSDEGDNEHNV